MKGLFLKSALVLPLIGLPLTLGSFTPSTYAQDSGGRSTLTEPLRIRAPKYANQPSTKKNPSCECPYDRAFRGSICGGRSSYAKPGGDEPRCYVGETTARQLWWYSPETQKVDENRRGQ
jgi:hypothetical protein